MTNIVVIGGNAAGLTAASRARRLDPRLEITVLEKSPHISYSTCGIPYYLAGDVSTDQLVSFTPARLKTERNIEARTNVQVEEVLPSRRRVLGRRTDTGESVSIQYDRLLIATGVHAHIPDIPGTDLGNVFSMTTLEDALRFRPALEDFRKLSIVGAGYVGLEMAESLRRMGKEVTIFERRNQVMPSMDPDMAEIVEYELRRHGVGVRTSSPVEALVGSNDRVTGLKAKGLLGFEAADSVLLDAGVRPNTGLSQTAGVRTGATGAIAVSEYLETNVPGIFAAGNCAEAFCLLRRRPILHHIGTVAAKQGRVAGENLAGRRSKFAGTVGTTILKVFDLAVGRTGLSLAEATSERISTASARIEALDRAAYYPGAKKVWVKLIVDRESRRVIGAQSAGYGDVTRPIDVAATAIMSSMTVDDLSQLDLAYSPPFGSLWNPLIVASQAVLRELQNG
jgi:NADPH-dependent 2,4-dienoyl-CoA reductase/sulfur reductase-like enzyme